MKKIFIITLSVLLLIACNKKPKEKIKLLPYGGSETTQELIELNLSEIFEFTIANSSIDTYVKIEDFRIAELNSYQDELGQKVYVITPNFQGKTNLIITDYNVQLKFEIKVKAMSVGYSLDTNKKQNTAVLEVSPLVSNLPESCDIYILVFANSDSDKVLDYKLVNRQQLEKYQNKETSEVMFIDTFDLRKKNQAVRNYELSLYALRSEPTLAGQYSYSSLAELLQENALFSCVVEFNYLLFEE